MKPKLPLLVAVFTLMLASLACQTLQPGVSLQEKAIPSPQNIPITLSTVVPAVSLPVSLPSLAQEQDALISLYERVTPGIVSLQVTTENGSGLGTGFVFDSQGHIITNEHVVDGQTRIEVDFASGYKAYGELVGIDKDSDIAVVKVNAPAEELTPLPLGDSSLLQVGQKVVAIGNPFGLNGTMTTGIISALGRTLPSNRASSGGGYFSAADLIQTDAAINPGNSGGPLFNLNGEVIGINRAIYTESSSASGEAVNSGIGFAIAINIARRVVPEIIANGYYDYPFMGISSIDDLTLDEIETLGLPQFTGAYVVSVSPGSPAAKAGLRAGDKDVGLERGIPAGGDLIIALDGMEVKTFDDLLRYLVNNKGPGDTIVLTVLREGESLDVSLILDKRP
jgi:2-alkenal reductase